jgi:Oxidoreductase molybdopterin binding domain
MSACHCNCIGMGKGMEMGQGKSMNMNPSKGMEMDPGMKMDEGMKMDHGAAKPAVPAGPLKIAFRDKSAEWTAAALAALPHKSVTVYNEHVKACQTYTGVPLIDLLTRLGVPDKPHGKDLRLYLAAEGSDGYMAVYSAAEVNPDVHSATVIVADTLDGKPLGESGPMQLVATGEKRPARWVRNLVAIRVLTAN